MGVNSIVPTEPERCHAPFDEVRDSETPYLAWWETL